MLVYSLTNQRKKTQMLEFYNEIQICQYYHSMYDYPVKPNIYKKNLKGVRTFETKKALS